MPNFTYLCTNEKITVTLRINTYQNMIFFIIEILSDDLTDQCLLNVARFQQYYNENKHIF